MKKLGLRKEDIVPIGRDYAHSIGMKDIPAVPKRTLSKMGLTVSKAGFDFSFWGIA